MEAIRRNWPAVALLVIWCGVVFAGAMAVANLFGIWAEVLYFVPVFVLSLIGGSWAGRSLR